MQQSRMSTRVVEAAEEALDEMIAARRNGTITPFALGRVESAMRRCVSVAAETDEALAYGLAVMRRGVNAPRALRLQSEYRMRQERAENWPPEAA